MQVTNNLQVPIEVQLCIPSSKDDDSDFSQDSGSVIEDDAKSENGYFHRYFAHPLIGIEALNFQDKLKESFQAKPKANIGVRYSMTVKAESSLIIPLKACNFSSVQIRPVLQDQTQSKDASVFEWSEEAPICLLQEESEIFEKEPVILSSKLVSLKKGQDVGRAVQKNEKASRVFFALNANTYSIRSFVDFNTQKTDFISLRYLSVTSPFVFQNLIPVPITMLFKNVIQPGANTDEEIKEEANVYDLTLKHNSSL
jgi:hypothetical protein